MMIKFLGRVMCIIFVSVMVLVGPSLGKAQGVSFSTELSVISDDIWFIRQIHDHLTLRTFPSEDVTKMNLVLRNGHELSTGDIVVFYGDHKNLPELFLLDKKKTPTLFSDFEMKVFVSEQLKKKEYKHIREDMIIETEGIRLSWNEKSNKAFTNRLNPDLADSLMDSSRYVQVRLSSTDSTLVIQPVQDDAGRIDAPAELAEAILVSVNYNTLYLLQGSEMSRDSITVKMPGDSPLRDKYMTTDHEELLERQVIAIHNLKTEEETKVEVFSRQQNELPKDVTFVEGNLKMNAEVVNYDILYLMQGSEPSRDSIIVTVPGDSPLRDKYMTTDHEELLERQVIAIHNLKTEEETKVEVFSRQQNELPKDVTFVEGNLKMNAEVVNYDILYLMQGSEPSRDSIIVTVPGDSPLRDKYMSTDHEELLEKQVTTVFDPKTGKEKKVVWFSRVGEGIAKALPKDVTLVKGDLKNKKVKAIKYFFPELELGSLPDVFVKKNDLPSIKELRSGGKKLELKKVRDVDSGKRYDVYVPPEFPNNTDLTISDQSGEAEVKKYILPTISLSLLLFMAL